LGRRPTTNPRRGIVRAAVTVVVLTALLIIAILVVSSLSAPTAKAPTNPPTPGPITPVTAPTATTPRALPSPTLKKKTLGSLLQKRPRVMALEQSPSTSTPNRAATWNAGDIAVRSHNQIAWFAPDANGTPARSLKVRSLPHGRTLDIGTADSLVKPVWSADGRFLLFVAASHSRTFPGAEWALMQYDGHRRASTRLASLPGVAMVPLGWWHAHALFLVATTSDTSLYTASAGGGQFLNVLAPQVITSAALSPGAPLVAFVAPTNCYNCTLDLFDLRTFTAWNGPSGMTDESEFAWSMDGRTVVTELHGRVAVVPASPGAHTRLGGKLVLPKNWLHSLSVSIQSSGVRLLDTINGRSVFSVFRGGTL
jgi:hypothetical protein